MDLKKKKWMEKIAHHKVKRYNHEFELQMIVELNCSETSL